MVFNKVGLICSLAKISKEAHGLCDDSFAGGTFALLESEGASFANFINLEPDAKSVRSIH